ncbi:MAG: aspartate aminotransferase family protein [Lachnospiraceae bacterium]|nr:aspartate aminotransferase family protein [Lachnospiraceae bacterium]
METKEVMERAEKVLMHTYGRYPLVLDHGNGMYLYDNDGKEYLDFAAGIGVFALGYNNKEYNSALFEQIGKLTHTSNYYYNIPSTLAAEKFTKASGMDRVFFTNSGTEAVEGAIKLARKYYYNKHGKADSEIIAMNRSFHGRTMGAVAVTGTESYRIPFEPLIGNVKFAEYNDFESVEKLITGKTAAIIMETLQGEGGIHPATEEFLKKIRKLCDDKDILLILDEVQCGMGRTGKMFAYQNFGILPDIMTSAKGLGSGVPVGAFAAKEKVATALVPGDHGSTYGGNPLVCAAVSKVFDIFEEKKLLENANVIGDYLWEKLEEFAKKHSDIVVEHRGMKMMQGLEFTFDVHDMVKRGMDNGLITIAAGAHVIRFLPPLIAEKKHVDEMMEKLEKSI